MASTAQEWILGLVADLLPSLPPCGSNPPSRPPSHHPGKPHCWLAITPLAAPVMSVLSAEGQRQLGLASVLAVHSYHWHRSALWHFTTPSSSRMSISPALGSMSLIRETKGDVGAHLYTSSVRTVRWGKYILKQCLVNLAKYISSSCVLINV